MQVEAVNRNTPVLSGSAISDQHSGFSIQDSAIGTRYESLRISASTRSHDSPTRLLPFLADPSLPLPLSPLSRSPPLPLSLLSPLSS